MTSSSTAASGGGLLNSELGRERRWIGLVFLALRKLLVGWEGGNNADTRVTNKRVLLSWMETQDPRRRGGDTRAPGVSAKGLGPQGPHCPFPLNL